MAEIKVQSVKEATRKAAIERNRFIQRWGEDDWLSGLLAIYLGGGLSTLAELQNAPYKWKRLLMDAHNYQLAELEFTIASAMGSANMEKKDRRKYFDELQERLRGNK